MQIPFNLPEGFDEAQALRIVDLVTKRNYTTETLKFISDYNSRLLNYWESQNLLPFKSTKQKRKKFSFIELIWIHIIKKLREFGFDGDKIKQVKEKLFESSPIYDIEETIIENDELKRRISEIEGVTIEKLEEFLNGLKKHKRQLETFRLSYLTSFVLGILIGRQSINLLISLDAHLLPYSISKRHSYELIDPIVDFLCRDHVSISLNDIVNFHLPKEYVQASLKNSIFTPSELSVLHTLKEKGLKSVEISFGTDEKINLIKKKYDKRIDITQRLSEIIMQNAFQDITITTQNGKIVHCTNTVKQKP